MFIWNSQNIGASVCFLIFIIVNLNLIASGTKVLQTESIEGAVCVNEGCVTKCDKNGSYELRLRKDCDIYYVNLDLENSASIINLTTSIEYANLDESWIDIAKGLKSTFDITINESRNDADAKEDETILMKQWHKTFADVPCETMTYLSSSPKVFITLTGTGNWSYYVIKFSFKEIQNRSDCVTKFNSNGSYELRMEKDCDMYVVNLDFENSASIINLTTSIKYVDQEADWKNTTNDLKPALDITVHESTIDDDTKEEESVLMKQWHKTFADVPCEMSYLSRSSKVFVALTWAGNWSHYAIKFSFKEIQYNLEILEPGNGTSTVPYRPNSVSLLSLESQKASWGGINVSFHNLIINTEMGDYILIGTGTKPYENKHSQPLYITQVPENCTFFVDDSSAFVAFVSGSDKKSEKDFKILWKGIEKKSHKLPDDNMGVLNSSLICFYSYSEAVSELKKVKKDERFKNFRQNFSKIAKEYLPKGYEDYDLSYKSVELFGPPTNVTGFDALSILIKITYGRESILTWRTLQKVIEKFNKTNTSGLKVGKCPEKYYDLSKDKYHVVFYALIPVFGLFGLMMWAWKQNIFAQNCLPEKEEKLSFGHMREEENYFPTSMDHVQAEPNAYVSTTSPKMRYDTEERSETLIQGASQQQAREASMVEMCDIPSTSQEQDTLTRYLSSKRNKSRPSIQSLLDNVEENKQFHSGKNAGNESDHLYDSVSSSKQLDETKL